MSEVSSRAACYLLEGDDGLEPIDYCLTQPIIRNLDGRYVPLKVGCTSSMSKKSSKAPTLEKPSLFTVFGCSFVLESVAPTILLCAFDALNATYTLSAEHRYFQSTGTVLLENWGLS